MFIARFRTARGITSLPIDRATLLEGMRLNGITGDRAVRTMNNIMRGIPVIVGECGIEKISNPPRWN